MAKQKCCNPLLFMLALSLALAGLLPCKAQSTEDCIKMIRNMEGTLPAMINSVKTLINGLIPNPLAYEKTLPSRDEVVSKKDSLNLRNYGGLSEAFLYADQVAKAEDIYLWFSKSSKQVLPQGETFPAAVTGDFGIYYFNQKNYPKAETLLLRSIADLEANASPSVYNNMITNYLLLALIRDKQGKKEEAAAYTKKMIAITVKQRQKSN